MQILPTSVPQKRLDHLLGRGGRKEEREGGEGTKMKEAAVVMVMKFRSEVFSPGMEGRGGGGGSLRSKGHQ
jgi:hypothetical protein